MSRFEEIRDRLKAAQHHGVAAFMIPTADVEYLLDEMHKSDEALTEDK